MARRHKGKIVLTERDIELLRWIGEQYAIRFDHLCELAGRISQEGNQPLSYQAMYRISTRWLKAGLIERTKIFAHQPMWLWLTASGMQAVGLDVVYKNPAISRLAHIHSVNAVRLYIESKIGEQIRWVAEREANAERKLQKKRHLVDGEVEFDDGVVIAIEVELTQKRRTRINAILRELHQDYETVWYFASKECRTSVDKAIGRLPKYAETFLVHDLSSMMKNNALRHRVSGQSKTDS